MRTRRTGWGAFAPVAWIVCWVGVVAVEAGAADQSLRAASRAFGRTHLFVIHFPIGLALSAALLEAIAALRRRPGPSESALTMLALGALLGIGAAATGWLHAAAERPGDGGEVLAFHRWFGIGAVAGLAGACVLGHLARKLPRLLWPYRGVVIGIAGLVGYAAHLGGVLVWGEGYVLAPFRQAAPGAPALETQTDGFQPLTSAEGLEGRALAIFESRCVECHGPTKDRAGLRLDSIDAVFDHDYVIVEPGFPEESDLVQRLRLPSETDGAMPPDGPPLSEAEIAVIEAWVLSLGAE